MKNRELFDIVRDAVNDLKSQEEQETEDGLIVIAVYKDRTKRRKSSAHVYINGYSPDEVDVLFRDIYAKVYAIRKRDDPKSKELNDFLEAKKNTL